MSKTSAKELFYIALYCGRIFQNAIEIDEDFNELYEITADSLTDYAVEIRYDCKEYIFEV
ncbi:MAG: hypothetical protein ACYCT7_08575 [bacterium]